LAFAPENQAAEKVMQPSCISQPVPCRGMQRVKPGKQVEEKRYSRVGCAQQKKQINTYGIACGIPAR